MDSINFSEIPLDKLDDAFSVISLCAEDLKGKGFNHWSDFYKDINTFKEKMSGHNYEVFVIYSAGMPVATFALSLIPPSYFTNPEFGEIKSFMPFFTNLSTGESVYVSALGVIPEFQGKGLAKAILLKIEEMCKAKGIKSIRFDTRAEFPPAVNLYKSFGYKIVYTDVVDEKESYYLFEKILD